jgi:deoxyadenosine/deoxycytidine kinase
MSDRVSQGDFAATLSRIVEKMGAIASPYAARPKDDAVAFIIDGEIAAGKTELMKALAAALRERGLRVCAIFEPVDKWHEVKILPKFYDDPERFAYPFQSFVYATRTLAIARAISEDPHADVYLLERSPATDLIFMELQRTLAAPVEMDMYPVWCTAWDLLLPINLARAQVLYLKTGLDKCMTRLAQRSRTGEISDTKAKHDGSATGGVTIEYQERLRRAHEAFFFGEHPGEFPHLPRSPFAADAIIKIGPELANGNFRDPGDERQAILSAIIEKMGL